MVPILDFVQKCSNGIALSKQSLERACKKMFKLINKIKEIFLLKNPGGSEAHFWR